MDKKRILASAAVFLILSVLVYLQYRHWQTFDWGTFWSQTHRIKKLHVVHAIALIYIAYVLRAIRWKLFLQPVRPNLKIKDLISATLIGFTGLALLGRAGEFIRPYLIARRADLPFSSQLVVWVVERIFDIGVFIVLMVVAVFREGGMMSVPPETQWYQYLPRAVLILVGLVLGVTIAAIIINRKGEAVASWAETRFAHLPAHLGRRIAAWVREFGEGLGAIHGPWSFLWLTLVSVGMWFIIAKAYQEVTHSYGMAALDIPLLQILILMGSSMVGSMLQLPAVGGGSQMATIATLSSLFAVPAEMAASCGILLWLVTFAAVIPLGLALAHHERLSLRKLSAESHQEESSPAG